MERNSSTAAVGQESSIGLALIQPLPRWVLPSSGKQASRNLDVTRDEWLGEDHFRLLRDSYRIKVLPRPILEDLVVLD
jgi:hypothetical protein